MNHISTDIYINNLDHLLNFTDYQFENYVFKGIEDYDYYLKSTYGDYMTPPPMGQREVHEVVGMYWK